MSWDRSRSIPWSKINQNPGVNPEAHKEQVFREMREEAQLEELLQQKESQQIVVVDGGGEEAVVKKGGIPFSGMEMAKQAAFGGCIGACIILWLLAVGTTVRAHLSPRRHHWKRLWLYG